ncbi:hypothetical protein IGB42_00503 [Andreprevotia sp. IGB-42]|uniref:substrate-binding periplasmic protein n=1 Tax=Andreprevotia sp. IGB-42 TaxID=2497473 RepID=UPI0013568022|nr:hypothetical protein [Andreprevotia sp. IGB-42]KAF0815422.1 hypothetical protein IGB42_00503 [Andreprevotia sp. IGB-42]
MRAPVLIAVWLLLLPLANAQTIRVCYDDQEGAVGEVRFKQSPNHAVLVQLEQQSGVHFEFEGRSWQRCMAELRTNVWDGAVAMSFLPERQVLAAFPMKNGKPDAQRRMTLDTYSLYRVRGSNVQWDGRHFSGVHGLVGVPPGYSIIGQLKEAGFRLDTSTRLAEQNLRKLLAGRIDAVALLTGEGDRTVAAYPEFASRIERIDPPLVTKPFYLVFSRGFIAANPDLAEKLWHALPAARTAAGL